jgi:hypothetical protein
MQRREFPAMSHIAGGPLSTVGKPGVAPKPRPCQSTSGFVNRKTIPSVTGAQIFASAFHQVTYRQGVGAIPGRRNGACVRIGSRSVAKSKTTMRRVINDGLISLGALVLLLVALVSIDDRVRERVTQLLTSPPSSAEIAGAGVQIENVSVVLFRAARNQSVDHAPLVIFSVAAVVLVLFMLRT